MSSRDTDSYSFREKERVGWLVEFVGVSLDEFVLRK